MKMDFTLPRPEKWACCLLAVICLAPGSVRSAGLHSIRAASVPAQISRTAAGGSFAPAFSGDGRHVAFISYAPNLVTNDDLATFYDVFIRNLATSNSTLVSVNLSGIGGGNDHSI